jgi:hypothetical protein
VLEFVPGVIVTQHSGDGKANQYFLRGFNLDHGTDFATSVNGVPVNMPTHGHGQGYTDLNFLIPELVDRIEYRKGPYFAQGGDFSAAGSADIVYRTALDAPFAALTLGPRQYQRFVGAGSTPLGSPSRLLAAVELQHDDGPWTVPERLRKANAVVTLSDGSPRAGWSASLTGYDASWTATDQVPQRLLDAGTYQGLPFGRFDTLDPADGGRTHRTSLCGEWHRHADTGATRVAAYAIDYGLTLYSDFTYALEWPAEGDQFSQQDRRRTYGVAPATCSTTSSRTASGGPSSACRCARTTCVSACSIPWRARSPARRATTRCARRCSACTGRRRCRWPSGCAAASGCVRTGHASWSTA